jgi:hypothetical protein
MLGSQQFFVGQGNENHTLSPNTSYSNQNPGYSGPATVAPSPLDQSQSNSIAQSYFILDKDLKNFKVDMNNQENDEEDPFNKFWDAVEGLVQRISAPVAFTTTPLTQIEAGISH